MNPKLIFLISFSYLYAIFEFVLSRIQKKGNIIEKSSDKGSVWAIIVAITLGFTLSFWIGANKFGRLNHWNTYFTIGLILMIIGLIIRIISILTLKKQFTFTVTKIENHSLIETGMYKFIRHPGYLGQIMLLLGCSISLANWLSIVGMMVPVLAGFIYRISVEEKFMVEQMGQDYLDYRKRTKRLIPGIY